MLSLFVAESLADVDSLVDWLALVEAESLALVDALASLLGFDALAEALVDALTLALSD